MNSEKQSNKAATIKGMQAEMLRQRGIKFHVQALEGGKSCIVIDEIPPLEVEINSFFFGKSPCWFAGCDELRKEFTAELERLDNSCGGCGRGALMRAFYSRVKSAILADKGNGGEDGAPVEQQ